MKKKLKKVVNFVRKHRLVLLILLLFFAFHLFFRIYEFEKRAQFTWDQVDTAWHAKNIIVNHEFPLTGMPAKQSASVSIGPYYYYFVTFFYLLTNLDPIASPIIATLVSFFSFFVLFFIANKLFNKYVAFIAIFINSFSFYAVTQDRIQWPVSFIAPIGLLIYYSLYKIIQGNAKYILLLALLLGLSFHIHFTSIFYLAIILFTLPLFPKKRKTLIYMLYAIPIMALWLIPFFISFFQKNVSLNILIFLNENNVGFHLRRVVQVADVAFLEPILILGSRVFDFLKYLILPSFLIIYYLKNKKKSYRLLYLTIIWFIVPWFALATFKGDLTPYYFAMTRYVALAICSYVIYSTVSFNKKLVIPVLVFLAILFAVINITQFLNYKTEGLSELKRITNKSFKESRGNEFIYGSGPTYLYYFYEYRAYGKK